jgi:hypothetical protein
MIELALWIVIKGHAVGVLPIKRRFEFSDQCDQHAAKVIKRLKPGLKVQWSCQMGVSRDV